MLIIIDERRGRWAKQDRRQRSNHLLEIIQQNQPITNSDLKKHIAVSDPTLSGYLIELEKKKLIVHFEKTDRRKKWYKIKPESKSIVNANIKKYAAIKFIESIKDPVYSFESSDDKNFTVSVFVLPVQEGRLPSELAMKILKKAWQKQIDNTAKDWLPLAKKGLIIRSLAKPGLKIAVVLTAES